ncbi:class I SAM-dependent methyltransferase [Reyranella sp.]|jgi:SAM-dependent methyltransferase|uniref:class I SAM-dependent methyltransferase n=1 Tax=Reyranella sp. TaxID=1929291 RepID=UPI002F944241
MARDMISTWNRSQADEDAMGATHAPIWRRMIDVGAPPDLRQSTVLDYGCNQGGFLRLLYDRHPFRSAVGIDIARESVARAELLKGHRPIDYRVGDQAAALGQTFDLAFSHEVIYLLPDPAVHARDIKAALRPGGAYVAAIGCHTDSGLWPRWRSLIAETSSIPIYDHSLEDVSKAFAETGFSVAVRPLALDAFMPFPIGSAYFPKVMDQLRYYSTDKVLFRFVRTP